MIILRNINLPLDTDFSDVEKLVANILKVNAAALKSVRLYKKSVDARHKNNIIFCCSFLIEADNETLLLKSNKKAEIYKDKKYIWKTAKNKEIRPVIIGFGPAGMFAALTFCKAGLKPIIIERGSPVEKRVAEVEEFFSGRKLNPESNIQFGEGGAGTFSDGKLNTGIKDSRISTVLELFHKFGANQNILYESKAHIGTDILRNVVKNIREEIISFGGEIRFNTKLTDIKIVGNNISSVKLTYNNQNEWLNCSHLILAIGHSARDTYEMLRFKGFEMERKPFSIGARVEHLQSDINYSLYGEFTNHKNLSAADYKMAVHLPTGRGVYTFCMCPGGEVVNASSEDGRVCVNGMSNSKRDGTNANSALLVEVKPDDLKGTDVLEGVRLQRNIEEKAYLNGAGVPFCYVGDLLGETVDNPNKILPTVKPKAVYTNIKTVLPRFVTEALEESFPQFAKRIQAFADNNAVLTFPETRSSSPVRILRNEKFSSLSVGGVYPVGEGAGYAGGIMSAAIDGMKVAESIIENT